MSTFVRSIVSASVLFGCIAGPAARAADNGVLSAIEKKYVVTETTADREQITKDGTTMAMKTSGIYTMPTGLMMSTPPDNVVVDGKIKPPNMFAKVTLVKFGAHVLQSGDKVYITKIDSKDDSGADVLKFSIMTTDSLDVNGQDAKKKYNGTVSFKFKKGYLDESPPEEIEAAIEAVMAPDTGDDAKAGESQAAARPSRPAPQAAPVAPPAPVQQAVAPAPAPPPAAAAAPPTISVGESSTQVLQALGMPQQMIDLGKKKTYVYKNLNMKIVFVDDKVTDVQ